MIRRSSTKRRLRVVLWRQQTKNNIPIVESKFSSPRVRRFRYFDSPGVGAGALVPAAMTEAPPSDAELTGMGVLPFVWYCGAVPDLELFGDGVSLETDDVASAPDVRRKIRAHLSRHPLDSNASGVAPSPPTDTPFFTAVRRRKSPLIIAYGPCFFATGSQRSCIQLQIPALHSPGPISSLPPSCRRC